MLGSVLERNSCDEGTVRLVLGLGSEVWRLGFGVTPSGVKAITQVAKIWKRCMRTCSAFGVEEVGVYSSLTSLLTSDDTREAHSFLERDQY